MDFNIKLSNGQVLRGMIQSPGENTKAVIILVHGLGEHIQRYIYWADLFKKEGIGFAGVDLPGHGRSEGRRGNITSYALLGDMIDILLNSCKKTFPGIPVFIYGHSLGGGIVLDYLLRRNPKVNGAIVTSPWLRLSFEPAKVKLIMAFVMKNLLPGLIQPSGLIVSHISHDEAVVEKYKTDPLVHGKISVSLFHGAMTAAAYSLKHASDLKVPTLMLHGSDDLVYSPEGSREFAGKTSLADLKIWDGGYHELHNEPFKDEVFAYIINWINRKLA
ncbi:MAG: alpha/beta hydrolase [Actinobacteria bacterium]|nr:alpha/beta hydrolase [Actinomycetota bacterium]